MSALFGGISVTGTIARTATNIRAGAISPLSGMMHALFVLLFMLVAAPLARYVPLSALAGVLLVVCWNMAEKAEFLRLIRSWPKALVLLATFGLTLVKDLKVKGAGQTLKRGTVIRSIRLTGDPQEIDCRHETIKGLVLRAEFVRKA